MVRFSCFHAQVHDNKPNKTVQPSTEAMARTSQDGSQNQASTDSSISSSSNTLFLRAQDMETNNSKNCANNVSSVEHDWRLAVLKSKTVMESDCDSEVGCTTLLKKSQSLESGLYQEGRLYADDLTEGYKDLGFTCNGSKTHYESAMPDCREDQEANPPALFTKDLKSQFQDRVGLGNNCPIFSIGDLTPSLEDAIENSDTPLTGEYIGDSADHTPGSGTPTFMVETDSFPNIRASTLSSGQCSFKHAAPRSRSSGDLHVLGMILEDTFINQSDGHLMGEQARENNLSKTEGSHIDSSFDDGDDSYPLSGVAKDWVVPVMNDINAVKSLEGECLDHRWDEFPNKDFNAKRIEDWVIALQHCGPFEETQEPSETVNPLYGDIISMNGVIADKVDYNVTPGLEAAKRYVSSLSANTTAAQLANHGLVVIPFLSAFASLKVLNLSGNSIVKITAGALPRGLHILNLSKNNVSTIEGLRELTRLRVLDLSYNRIHRIGHGLASCSSIKELYLAGNKISEIDGLHRLLKLSVLDLRFNKISTAKCLGQLAANYNSLQAINLEGNPAQKNVGDEHLKKYLHDLLPHLAYYNRQLMKSCTLKDASDRSVRFCCHQLERSLRSDNKTTGKGGYGSVAAWKPSFSSTHAHRSQTVVSPKLSKGKQGHLPPIGTKISIHGRHPLDVSSKPVNFRRDAIGRSCSEGTLGVL